MRLEGLTRPELILPTLHAADARDGEGVLRAFANEIVAAGRSPGAPLGAVAIDADELYQKLAERERLGSTAVGGGVAIPHCKLKGLERPVVAIGRVEPGLEFGAPDGRPVRAFFVVVSPLDTPAAHLQVLSAVSRWIKEPARLARLLELETPERIWEMLAEE